MINILIVLLWLMGIACVVILSYQIGIQKSYTKAKESYEGLVNKLAYTCLCHIDIRRDMVNIIESIRDDMSKGVEVLDAAVETEDHMSTDVVDSLEKLESINRNTINYLNNLIDHSRAKIGSSMDFFRNEFPEAYEEWSSGDIKNTTNE